MELIMEERELSYLERLFHCQIPLEETAELIVPDKCADAEEILDAFGTLLLRETVWEQGILLCKGTVRGVVLFRTVEGRVERLETELPFDLRREWNAEGMEGVLQYRCELCSVDGKILNSRKLLLRVGIICKAELYGRQNRILRDIEEPSENLQLLRGVYPVKLPVDLAEKSFTFTDEPELPELSAPIARLLKVLCQPRVLEQKAAGGKGVFKTELLLHILYADEEDQLHSHDWRLPLSQYVDFPQDIEGGELQTILHVTELDLEPDSSIRSRRLFLRMGLRACTTVYDIREMAVIRDAFCTDGLLEPKWQRWQCRSLLDRQLLSGEARWKDTEDLNSVVDMTVFAAEPELCHSSDLLELRIPLCCNVLYRDKEGQLRGKLLRSISELTLPLHTDGEAVTGRVHTGTPAILSNGGNLELRLPLQIQVDSYGLRELQSLDGGQISPFPFTTEKRPSLLLCRTEGEESLWDIAKHHNTSVEAISKANDLTDPILPQGTMLLIPL